MAEDVDVDVDESDEAVPALARAAARRAELGADDDTDDRISRRVQVLLVHRHMTRKALAEHLEISLSSLSRSLSDTPPQRRAWSARDLRRLADLFDVEPTLFLAEEPVFWKRMSELPYKEQR